MNADHFLPTVVPKLPFNPEQEAAALHKAFKGLGTNEKEVNRVLGSLTLAQRHKVAEAYEQTHRKSLESALESELSGDYYKLAGGLMLTPVELLARDLYDALKKSKPNYPVMNEIICCANNKEIEAIRMAYSQFDKKDTLDEAIAKDYKGDYLILLQALLKANRDEDNPEKVQRALQTMDFTLLVDRNQLEQDTKAITKALTSGVVDTRTLIEILTSRSKHTVRGLCELYNANTNNHLVDTISETVAEPLCSGLNTVVMGLLDLRLLLACQMMESFQGRGMREETLSRIVILRSEIDLGNLRQLFDAKFDKPLMEYVKSETKGDLRDLLTVLLEP